MPTVVHPGPRLLRPGASDLAGHRLRSGEVPRMTGGQLVALTGEAALQGRGGAGFPYARKLATALTRRALRRHLVVNVSEGEPASAKDAALVGVAPHLVLDGALLTARALRASEVHLVVADDDPLTERQLRHAVDERGGTAADQGLRWRFHRARARFVAGESSAVLELVRGNENLPVTSWVPAAERGLEGRPTLVCNAETVAQVAALALGLTAGPSGPTRILSIERGQQTHVVEVEDGTPWSDVLDPDELDSPVLLGGYHGVWLGPGRLRAETISDRGPVPLGAGVVIPVGPGACPLQRTSELLEYLAGQSARRCGPCVHGLPALARAHEAAVRGAGPDQVVALARLVEGRGACAHPDGTARLARSAVTEFADDLAAHRAGGCLYAHRTAAEAR